MNVQVCFDTLQFDEPWTLENYLKVGGYKAWKKVLQEKMPPEVVIEEVKKSGLRGRGGAGFKTGMKWRFCKQAEADQHYVVCNADEGEPGTFKDRVLLNSYADQVFEGFPDRCARHIEPLGQRGLVATPTGHARSGLGLTVEVKNFLNRLTFPNVLVTAHQGFFTEEAIRQICETTLANITQFDSDDDGIKIALVGRMNAGKSTTSIL